MTRADRTEGLSGRQRFLGSAVWTASSRAFLAILSIATLAILSRLLEPSDFGVLAIALVFANLAQRFQDLGSGLALIQAKDVGREAQHVGFTIALASSTIVAVVLAASAGLIARLSNEPRIVADILRALAITFPLGAFAVVPRALMRRDMKLKGEATVTAVSTIVESVATIALAWIGWGVAALVAGRIVATAATAVGLAIARPWSLGLRVRGGGGRFMVRFGGGLTVSNLLFYGYSNIDFLLIGRILGEELLGVYHVAWRVAKMPWDRLWATISPLILPALSRHREDQVRMGSTYLTLSRYLALLTFPALGGLAACADDVVSVLFDARYAAATLPLRLLCVFGAARAAIVLLPPLLAAREQVRRIVWFNAVGFVVLPVGFWLSLDLGVEGPAWVWAVAYPSLAIGMLLPLATKVTTVRVAAYFRTLSVPAMATGVMALAVASVGLFWAEPSVARLATKVALGAVVYGGVVVALEGPIWRELIALVRDARRGLSA